MNIRTAIKRFNTLYGKKKGRGAVAAAGQWRGYPEGGMSASELRKEAKRLGVSTEQLLRSLKRKGRKGGSSSPSERLSGKYAPGSGNYYRG